MDSHFLNSFEKRKEVSIVINSDNHKFVHKRFCIVPNHWNEMRIHAYLERSLEIPRKSIALGMSQEVMFFHKGMKDFEVSNKRFIDYYWYDVKEFFVEFSESYPLFYLTVVAGYDCEEEDIQQLFVHHFPDKQINVEYFRDCWLSKFTGV